MCGVFGIHGFDQAARITCLGLYALQHRGQESAGIAATSGRTIARHAAMGLVADAFTEEQVSRLAGTSAIGHVRYSTAGGSELRNAQPFVFDYVHGSVAIAHNGNLLGADAMRARLEQSGAVFQTSSDTELIVHLLARAQGADITERLASALSQVRGAYSLLVMTGDSLIAVRDPNGFRPLCMGRLGRAHVFSSETVSMDLIDAAFVREIEPGEMVVVDASGARSLRPFDGPPREPEAERRACVFERIYFARPDSQLDGQSVYRARELLGQRLAVEHPVDADVVIPIPDSGVPAAIGYARQSGLPYGVGLLRSHWIGRTFIEPHDALRHLGVRLKFSPIRAVVEGKRVVAVDDSLVRGTTAREIVKMLEWAGAREVHLRISAPPTTHPCFYGIDIPTHSELIAASLTVAEIARAVTCDSLAYLSHQGMLAALGAEPDATGYCTACFTGAYPVSLGVRRQAIGPAHPPACDERYH